MATKKPPRLWLRHHRFTEKPYQPYVTAIGQLLLAWSDLHERLAILFWVTTGGGYANRPTAMWNSSNFDRPRREMLKAVVNSSTPKEQAQFPKMVADINWILTETDKLEDARNTAIHAPLYLFGYTTLQRGSTVRGVVAPNDMLQNPRELKLAQKDLLTEFRWCRDCALVLRDFASQIDAAMGVHVLFPWPDRPSLPNRGQKKRRQTRPRPAQPK
jgi:hypothetical protein